jgi:hypothetical protein
VATRANGLSSQDRHKRQKAQHETSFPRKQTKVHIQFISMIRQQIAILASYRLSESHGWPRDYDLWAIAKAVLPSQH